MALDAKVKRALNDFHKTQPALNIDGQPNGHRGIMLGDLLDALFVAVEILTAKLDLDIGVADENYADIGVNDDESVKLG